MHNSTRRTSKTFFTTSALIALLLAMPAQALGQDADDDPPVTDIPPVCDTVPFTFMCAPMEPMTGGFNTGDYDFGKVSSWNDEVSTGETTTKDKNGNEIVYETSVTIRTEKDGNTDPPTLTASPIKTTVTRSVYDSEGNLVGNRYSWVFTRCFDSWQLNHTIEARPGRENK